MTDEERKAFYKERDEAKAKKREQMKIHIKEAEARFAAESGDTELARRYQLQAREARVRNRAKQLGLRLEKSRSRTPELPEWGTYQLVDENRIIVASGGPGGYGLSIEEVENALNEEEGGKE